MQSYSSRAAAHTVIPEPPAPGHCCGLRVLQTEGKERVEVVQNSNSFTDTCHTLQQFRHSSVSIPSQRRSPVSLPQRLVSVDQVTGDAMGPQ